MRNKDYQTAIWNKDEFIWLFGKEGLHYSGTRSFHQAAPERTSFKAKWGERQYLSTRSCIVDCFQSLFANKWSLADFMSLIQRRLVSTKVLDELWKIPRGICLKYSKISISHPADTMWQHNIYILRWDKRIEGMKQRWIRCFIIFLVSESINTLTTKRTTGDKFQ